MRSLRREFAVDLLAQLRKAAAKPEASIENRAHLNESVALLDGALGADCQGDWLGGCLCRR
ncbi:MAG: hypothetical protein U1F05_11055 [Burkholderiales bacterium]